MPKETEISATNPVKNPARKYLLREDGQLTRLVRGNRLLFTLVFFGLLSAISVTASFLLRFVVLGPLLVTDLAGWQTWSHTGAWCLMCPNGPLRYPLTRVSPSTCCYPLPPGDLELLPRRSWRGFCLSCE